MIFSLGGIESSYWGRKWTGKKGVEGEGNEKGKKGGKAKWEVIREVKREIGREVKREMGRGKGDGNQISGNFIHPCSSQGFSFSQGCSFQDIFPQLHEN